MIFTHPLVAGRFRLRAILANSVERTIITFSELLLCIHKILYTEYIASSKVIRGHAFFPQFSCCCYCCFCCLFSVLLLLVLSFLSLEVKYLKHTLVLHGFQCSYSTRCRSPKILLKHCLQFLFGQFLYPGETENNFYGRGKQGVFWAMSEWQTEPLAFQCIYEISRKLTK